MPSIYHLLTECEPFSEHHGGAISRWVANVTRFDEDAIILAPSSDQSWGFAPDRVRDIPGLARHHQQTQHGTHLLPTQVKLAMLRRKLLPALRTVASGDTVWIHNRPEFAAALAPVIHERSARLVLHLHNSHLVQWSERITRSFEADRYVFVSRFLQDEALEKFPDLQNTVVLNNGADQHLFRPKTKEHCAAEVPIVLFASRLVPDKGLHIFLDAMRQLKRQGTELQGIVVGGVGFGESKPSAYLREAQAGAPANVRFEPYCAGEALANRFRAADIFCLPACWNDPFPMVVLEAMATALPVVATKSGGIPDQLADGGGLLVERRSVDELAKALGRLAGDRELREELGRQALESFHKSFTWSTVRSNYRKILEGTSPAQLLAMEQVEEGICA